ncbi:MAG: alpha/beta fold hydrolase [Clostridiales bacterium]|nr:alpha/beta fold hydrolase [Clostridiales bacterium]
MPQLFSPHAQPFFYEGGSHGVLLLHGFTACPAQMIPLGKRLHEAGFSVRAVRLPGHGTSPEDMKKSTWQDWLGEALQAAEDMQKSYPHFSIAGLSMGGALTLILAAKLNPTCCVTLAAPTAANNPLARFAGILHPIYPTVHTRVGRTSLGEYDLGYPSYPTKKVADLNRIIRMSNESLPRVTCPLLSVQSVKDKTIVPESMDLIQRRAGSRIKEHLWLREAPHVVTLSTELPLIADTMIRFLRAQEK